MFSQILLPFQMLFALLLALGSVPAIYLSYRICRTTFALIWAIVLYKVIPQFYSPALHRFKHRWTGEFTAVVCVIFIWFFAY